MSSSLQSIACGLRRSSAGQAASVIASGVKRNAHDSDASASSHFLNGGVQNVGLRSVVSVSTSTPSEPAKYDVRPPAR